MKETHVKVGHGRVEDKKWIYAIGPVLGFLFCLIYLNRAVIDVAYTDYIRLINSYLPDVWNPKKFFVADVLTRIPLNYLERAINVTWFGYNTMIEMVLGVVGLGLSAGVIAAYSAKHRIRFGWYVLIMAVLFSLNKWEMLTNGTGWIHFAAFACFYYHYLILDRVYRGEGKQGDPVRLCLLPFLVTLGVAGPYCAIYSATVILACLFAAARKIGKAKGFQKVKKEVMPWLMYAVCALVPLFLYMWSNSHTVEEHAGAVEASLLGTMLEQPWFFIEFFIKSFASTVLGDECIRKICGQEWQILILGAFVLGCYCFALYLNWSQRLYERTIFPLMLLAAGGMNHVLILLSRWIFLKPDYGMSSRYALQFQVGIVGILLTFAFAWQKGRKKKQSRGLRMLCVLMGSIFLLGNTFTTYSEWNTAPYRKQNLIAKREAALHYEELSDRELEDIFQYKKGPDQIRNALKILKDHNWNVFREQED